MSYEPGDIVLIVSGDFEGREAVYVEHDEIFGVHIVEIEEGPEDGTRVGCADHEIEQVYLDDDDEEEAPPFGMSRENVAKYAKEFGEFLANRVREAPGDDELGYQPFEEVDTTDVLTAMLAGIEELGVSVAKAHIRVSRMVAALKPLEES